MPKFNIIPDCFDGDEVTVWGIYDAEDNFVASFETLAEAQQFIS